jgi:hypothetical protein
MPGLIVNGTITRTKVAPGADLVAYSGFSASNYLEQPYNPDLDFGTGDFCVMGWVKTTANGGYIASTIDAAVNDGIAVFLNNGAPYLRCTDGGLQANLSGTTAINTNSWRFFVALRKDSGTTLELSVDGALSDSSTVSARNTDGTNSPLFIGQRADLAFALNGSLALLRISATAPTAEQIKKIYNDEKVLFQDNAQATLYGASDAVTGLAYDEDTDLLHVGTSAGRSIFNGLRRINNTTTGVTTAISANNGVIAEQ